MHGTTGEAPLTRFLRDEAHRLQPLADRPSFQPMREWVRRVQADCSIELHRNWYSVPWRLLGETVRVVQQGERLSVHHGATVVAEHVVAHGTRVRRVDPAHLVGITTRRVAGVAGVAVPAPLAEVPAVATPASSLLRPLSEYAAVAGEWAA